jgi:hypothetical protein
VIYVHPRSAVVAVAFEDFRDRLTSLSGRSPSSCSLALHSRIAQKIAVNPLLIGIARRNVKAWSRAAGKEAPRYLAEWRRILERPWPQIAALITEQSERAARLRQSSPFAGVLTAKERRRIYDAFRA